MLTIVDSPHGVHQIGERPDIPHIDREGQFALQVVQRPKLIRRCRVPDVAFMLVEDDPVQTPRNLRIIHIRSAAIDRASTL